ncbi:hypothetical protein CYMTET_17723 [Cymbomonas tetramitiformis]|uniref:Uncharacterized protein n=1 Tax=Cymbomonas tetramitiformis TaxID=36881 RepID=A0AAE0G9S4_9CHLO|nr:hypothetical protein CYMTET_17723 [Cymbomonas tetramitiformis]
MHPKDCKGPPPPGTCCVGSPPECWAFLGYLIIGCMCLSLSFEDDNDAIGIEDDNDDAAIGIEDDNDDDAIGIEDDNDDAISIEDDNIAIGIDDDNVTMHRHR